MNGKSYEATGAFWGASLFAGILLCVILGFRGNSWLFSIVVGLCVFLMSGLAIQGLVALFKKDSSHKEES